MAQHQANQTAPRAVEVEFHRVGVAVVRLRGEHDLSSKQALSEGLSDASDQLNVIVDLSECTFMDSSVIATFYVARKSLGARGGRLELVIPPEAITVQRVATITRLAKLLPIHETHGAGIASFQPGEHSIQVRDLRLRFGDPEAYAAQCSCGWLGETRATERPARRDGTRHFERERIAPTPQRQTEIQSIS